MNENPRFTVTESKINSGYWVMDSQENQGVWYKTLEAAHAWAAYYNENGR